MSWDAALEILYSASPSSQQVDALQLFCNEHELELKEFSSTKYAPLRPVLAKFISKLFSLLETKPSGMSASKRHFYTVIENISSIFTRKEFFTTVFKQALQDVDVDLLELIYSSLFTEIVFTSDLTCVWFENLVEISSNRKENELNQNGMINRNDTSTAATISNFQYALLLLTCVQFIDVRQDWCAIKPKSEFLVKLDGIIQSCEDPTIKLVWSLAVYSMAKQHYSTEDDDGIEMEALMHSIQVAHGVHWSTVLRNNIQMSINGIKPLIIALDVIRNEQLSSKASKHTLHIINMQILSQTVADTISKVLEVTKSTDELCFSLAKCTGPYPQLQQELWVPEDTLALLKSKCPASIFSLICVAETLDLNARIELLGEMVSYVSEVDIRQLDVDRINVQEFIGTEVRSTEIITVLPSRESDHQGALELDIGTRGTLLAVESDYCLVMWHFAYSGWSLLGRVWENGDLKLGCEYDDLTTQILRLTSNTMNIEVLARMSAGLSHGDIVDLLANRLQMWLYQAKVEEINGNKVDRSLYNNSISLAFDFLSNLASIDTDRVWALLNWLRWDAHTQMGQSNEILKGVDKVIRELWHSFNSELQIHANVIDRVVDFVSWTYVSLSEFETTIGPLCLSLFKLIMPQNKPLRDQFLSPSISREAYLAPLLKNLHNKKVLDFCIHLVKVESGNTQIGSREQSCLDRELFKHSKELTDLFLEHRELNTRILHLWSLLSLNTEAPPLLAFIGSNRAKSLKTHLIKITTDKMESDSLLAHIAFFLTSCRREEGLLELLTVPIVPNLQERVISMSTSQSLVTILDSFVMLRCEIKPELVAYLMGLINNSDEEDLGLLAKSAAIKVISKLVQATDSNSDNESKKVLDFIDSNNLTLLANSNVIGVGLSQKLAKKWSYLQNILNESNGGLTLQSLGSDIYSSSDVQRHVENKYAVIISWCDLLRVASTSKLMTDDKRLQWAFELVEANTTVTVPVSTQVIDTARTETAAIILIQNDIKLNQVESAFKLLTVIADQLGNITNGSNSSLDERNTWLTSLLQMSALILAKLSEKQRLDRQSVCFGKNVSVISNLLENVIVKQFAIMINTEDNLRLRLSILMDSLPLLNGNSDDINSSHDENVNLESLVKLMDESGSDLSLINLFGSTNIDQPVNGELILRQVYEWLSVPQMMSNFIRKGLVNVLIDGKISRCIQNGSVLCTEKPQLHSVWRLLIAVVLKLLNSLGQRFIQECYLFVSSYSKQICTCMDQWKSGQITMGLIEETLLLYSLLTRLNNLNSNPNEPFEVHFDPSELSKNVELLLSHKRYTSSRISSYEDENKVIEAMKSLGKVVQNSS